MKAKEIAAQTGLKERTIRFYEEHDLIHPATEQRNGRNYREYTQADADRLRLIATLRRSQFTLEEIRQLLCQPDTTPQIFRAYTARMEQAARDTKRLWTAAAAISPENLTPQALGQALEQQVRNLSLPPADLEPHFGKNDPETSQEKQRAINAYHARQAKKRISPQTVLIAVLGTLCVLLALGWGLWGYLHRPVSVQPDAAGTTEGYIYYRTYENGSYLICRYEESTGKTETIYESAETTLAFTVTPEKLYVSDGQGVYSVNPDGSGKYLLTDGLSAVSGCMQVYDGMLYGIEPLVSYKNRSRGTLARVSLSGGKVETLDIGVSGTFEIEDGVLYAGFGGTLTATNLSTLDTTEYDISSADSSEAALDSMPEAVLWSGKIAFALNWWNNGESQWGSTPVLRFYSPEPDGSFSASDPIPLPEYTIHGAFYVHNGYLYYYTVEQNQPDSVQLWRLNPENGESTLLAENGLSDYPVLSFGQHGILVGTGAESPLYLPDPE